MGYKTPISWITILALAFLLGSAVLVGWGIAHLNAVGIAVGVIGSIVLALWIYNKSNINITRLQLLLEAIRNNDYSFKSQVRYSSHNDKIVFETLNEITALLKDEKLNIAQQEKYYEVILNTLSTGIIVASPKGEVRMCNQEAVQMFGLPVLTNLVQLNKYNGLDASLIELRENEKLHVTIKPEQKEMDFSIRMSALELRGEMLRVFTLNDIHAEIDQKEFDSWIKLTRVLTHEIMNGIAPIRSLSESLISMHQTPPQIEKGLEAINETSKGILNFVESYRKFTTIPKPEPSLVYVTNLLDKAKSLIDFEGVKIEISIDPEDLIIFADPNLILQVVINILKNGVQSFDGFECENPQIKISAYTNPSEAVVISISNNGPAVSLQEADQIFMPFYTTKANGSGIGLAVSRQIMHLSGGRLTLSSQPSEQFATTFTLSFES